MSSYEQLVSEITSDVLSQIDLSEVVEQFDTSEIAGELCVEDVASYVEIDPADVNWEEIVGNVLMREYDVPNMVEVALKMRADDITALHKMQTENQDEALSQIDRLRYDVSALRETVLILNRKLARRPWWKFWG